MSTRRVKEDQNLWNFLFSVFFVIVLVVVVRLVWSMNGSFPQSIPVFDAALLALASFRITRLVVYDKITRWFRELFADSYEFEENGIRYVAVRPFGSGLRHTIGDLLQCPWCIGFWGALATCTAYVLFPWAWFVILFLAVAGAGSLLQVIANGVGWRAENLKMEAKEKDRNMQL